MCLVNSGETPDVPTVSFYAERRIWIWSSYMSDVERGRALSTSDYAVLSLPPPDTRNPVVRFWHHFRGFNDAQERKDFPPSDKFSEIYRNQEFIAYKKTETF